MADSITKGGLADYSYRSPGMGHTGPASPSLGGVAPPQRCSEHVPSELALVVPTVYGPCIVLHFLESILLRVQAMGEQRATNPHRNSAHLNCTISEHGDGTMVSGVKAGNGNERDVGAGAGAGC
jgi:hypothetical protein